MTIGRRAFVVRSAAVAAGWVGSGSVSAWGGPRTSAVVLWNEMLRQAVVNTAMPATPASRACSMVNEAIYNAWAAYDSRAAFTLPRMSKRSFFELGDATKSIAISWAAYTVLADLFPARVADFTSLLKDLTGGIFGGSLFGQTARQVGEYAANALLQLRHADGSNQLGDLAPGAYADYSGYVPVNTPDKVNDPTRWQPLRVATADGGTAIQKFLTPFWGQVRPFALKSSSMFRPVMDHRAPSAWELQEMQFWSAQLDDELKARVDFFAQNPGHGSPPTQWIGFAEQVSAHDGNSLDEDVKLFFACGQAVFDAGIACWDAKRVYDSVRPVTAVPFYLQGVSFVAWAGYNQGIRTILADNWMPYQPPTVRTPSFPEFPSGHSTFSGAAWTAMAGLRGSDAVTINGSTPAGGISFETNMPPTTQYFSWPSLSAVAAAAGLSRRQCGIHFRQGDLNGRALGAKVGAVVLAKCKALFAGQAGYAVPASPWSQHSSWLPWASADDKPSKPAEAPRFDQIWGYGRR